MVEVDEVGTMRDTRYFTARGSEVIEHLITFASISEHSYQQI